MRECGVDERERGVDGGEHGAGQGAGRLEVGLG